MLSLSITTPERRVAGPIKVRSVTVPGERGEMSILEGHARLLSTLGIGVLSFEGEDGKKITAAVAGGFVQVEQDRVTVLAETLELAQEIDLERARKAQAKAEERLKAKETFEEDMEDWQAKLHRAQIRQHVKEFLLPQ